MVTGTESLLSKERHRSLDLYITGLLATRLPKQLNQYLVYSPRFLYLPLPLKFTLLSFAFRVNLTTLLV